MTEPNQPKPVRREIRSRAARIAGRLLLFFGVPYVLLCVMLGFVQRKLIYIPFKAERISTADAGLPDGRLRDIVMTGDDGIELHGWHFVAETVDEARAGSLAVRSSRAAAPVVLYFSGNAAHRLWRLEECGVLTSLGCDVYLFDYRGYGENAGSPSEEAIAADARAAWRFLTDERDIAPERIVFYGESIGGAVAIRLASELCESGMPPAGLIARSTFSSLADVGSYHYPIVPVRWLLVERYNSVERIGGVTCPMLILHGDADEIVPIRLGRKVSAAAPRTSAAGIENRFIELNGADHNNVLATHRGELREAVAAFLARLSP